MPKLLDLIQNIFKPDQINSAAKLLYLTGGIDGEIKSGSNKEEISQFISQMLEQEMTTSEFNDYLQKNYFQKFRGSSERQQIEVNQEIQKIREIITPLLDNLGFISQVSAQGNYNMALVFGATQSAMSSRFNQMLKEVAVDEIYILAGARDLWLDAEASDPCCALLIAERINQNLKFNIEQSFKNDSEIDVKDHSKDVAEAEKSESQNFSKSNNINEFDENNVKEIGGNIFRETEGNISTKRQAVVNYFESEFNIQYPTEADAARYIISQQTPEIQNKSKLVNAQKKQDGSRPDTFDTVIALKNQFPEILQGKKTAVAISDQPNILAQYITLKLLPENIATSIIGKKANLNRDAILEETLAAFAGVVFKQLQLEKYLERQNLKEESLKEQKPSAVAIPLTSTSSQEVFAKYQKEKQPSGKSLN